MSKVEINSAIQVEQVSKSYGDTLALNQISLSVQPGELFGLIGPDGAGKTTLFRILVTLLLPDEGTAWVNGAHVVHEYQEIRKKVGYMPGKFSLYQDLSVQENLAFFATIFGTTIEENYHLIKDIYVQLEPFKKRLAGNLSGGMKQKLALCCALIHKPTVLFLDEPTTGVDAVSRKEFWVMLDQLKQNGITILVSTPYMDEASLCDRIALMQDGKLLTVDRPEQLIEDYQHPLYAVKADNFYRLLAILRGKTYTQSVLPFGDSLHLTTNRQLLAGELANSLKDEVGDVQISQIKPTVEDVFLDLSSS